MTAKAQTSSKIRGRDVAKYMLLPGILPRAKSLGTSGFGYLAFLIASVYQAVRILPATHPYTKPANMGTFGIRQVIAAAADHVIFDRKHIDQIIIFFAVLAGVILLGFQFLAIIFLLFSGEAFAQSATGGTGFAGMFVTQQPAKDIAFLLLDHVLGVPDFFKSEALKNGPTPFHLALQTLFKFYNLALLLVAVLIFLYFVLVVVAETALHGTPFGRRFNTIYAPLRLVFAIGLLVPLNHGLNASQYIVLGAARAGSGFATNAWTIFNRNMTNPMGVEHKTLIADVKAPENINIIQFYTVAHACKTAYKLMPPYTTIDAYLTFGQEALKLSATDYKTIMDKTRGGDVQVTIGEQGTTAEHKKYAGSVIPYCGKLNIPLSTRNPSFITSGSTSGGSTPGTGNGSSVADEIGPEGIQMAYFKFIRFAWTGWTEVQMLGERFAYALIHDSRNNPCIHGEGQYGGEGGTGLGDSATCKNTFKPPSALKQVLLDGAKREAIDIVNNAVRNSRGKVDLKLSEDIKQRGWGGAGIWYNQIAEMNGSMVAAAHNFPMNSAWTLLMQDILNAKTAQDGKTEVCNRFTQNLSNNQPDEMGGMSRDVYVLATSVAAYRWWYCDNTTERKGMTANAFWDAMHLVFGSSGLFKLRHQNPDDQHPLAALTVVGKSLVEHSIRNMGFSLGSAVAGGFLGAISPHWGASVEAMSRFFVSVAMIGLTAGFILFYILPFLPFIYFFFALGAWVKTVFEAMVGAPLWALAHLRIEGDGFPGPSAANGYFLIFEIFIRPILTLAGLLGGMAIFTALVVILNDLFSFVVFQVTGTELSNASGTNTATGGSIYTGEYEDFRRSVVDEFFFTILYAILVYMLALSSFKMIDLVPNQILRWMGAGVSTFSGQAGDPKEGLVQYAALGGNYVSGQLGGAINNLGKTAGSVAGAVAGAGTGRQGGGQGGGG